jgi:hypothetical protein
LAVAADEDAGSPVELPESFAFELVAGSSVFTMGCACLGASFAEAPPGGKSDSCREPRFGGVAGFPAAGSEFDGLAGALADGGGEISGAFGGALFGETAALGWVGENNPLWRHRQANMPTAARSKMTAKYVRARPGCGSSSSR